MNAYEPLGTGQFLPLSWRTNVSGIWGYGSRSGKVTRQEQESAGIGFRAEGVDAASSRVQDGPENEGIGPAGQPFLMRHDPPRVAGFPWRNEVGIEVRR
jgi:hypothetical protein